MRAEAARLVAGSQRDRTSAAQLEAVAFLMGNQLSSVETLPERVPYKMPVFVAEGTPVVVVSASGQVKANATAAKKEG